MHDFFWLICFPNIAYENAFVSMKLINENKDCKYKVFEFKHLQTKPLLFIRFVDSKFSKKFENHIRLVS